MTLDEAILVALRPPGGGPETIDDIRHTVIVCRMHDPDLAGVQCTERAIVTAVLDLARRGLVRDNGGRWEYVPQRPQEAARQRALF